MARVNVEDESIRVLRGYKFKVKGKIAAFDKVFTSRRARGGRWISAPIKFIGKSVEIFKAVATPVSGRS